MSTVHVHMPNLNHLMCVPAFMITETLQRKIYNNQRSGGRGALGAEAPLHCWSLLDNMLKIIMNFSLGIVYMITNTANTHKPT